jgi:hypothetical protein
MNRAVVRGILGLTVAVFGAAGCDESRSPTPTVPTPVEITEPPFTGTLEINGALVTFFTTGAGQVTALVKSLATPDNPNPDVPDINLVIGLDLGTSNGTSCQIGQGTLANPNVGIGSGVAGIANVAGNLCARVYDPGHLTGPVNFEVEIKHF